MSDSKNNTAWEKLFTKYQIAEKVEIQGFYKISSKAINEFREARLMTKFDHKSQLPKLFTAHQLSILPISRGDYLIAKIQTFHSFDKNIVPITKMDFPNHLESIDFHNITSEAAAINCAYVSGIFEDFLNEKNLKPTVSGRMSSLSFDFKINQTVGTLDISVNNSQIEIDGGYEGAASLSLVEAKNSISKDFLIRQLYYPFRLWQSKIEKRVRSIFLTYTNGVFHLREYAFDDANTYNSIRLVQQKKYILRKGAITLAILQKVVQSTQLQIELPIPFPQADYFERVINLCELLYAENTLSREVITENYDFDVRQTNYYTDAGRYLGIIDREKEEGEWIYFLTSTGKGLFKKSIEKRQIEFARLIVSHLVFNQVLRFYLKYKKMPSKEQTVAIMKTSNLYKINSDSTYRRRAATILSWINWIVELID